MARALIAGLIAAVVLLGTTAAFAARPVQIKISVIEASKRSKTFDPRIGALEKGIVGFSGAKLLDEVSAKVEPGASVSIEFRAGERKRREMLRVTVRDAKAAGPIQLTVEIVAFKFEATTTHKKSGATVFVAHPTGDDTALFLAITPTLAKP